MNPLRQTILDLSRSRNLGDYTYRQLGELLGGVHPYQVQYNIQQLVKKGYLLENKRTGTIAPAAGNDGSEAAPIIKIPVMGSASCGTAVAYAANEHLGFVAVSPSLVDVRSPERLFALCASGDSMNAADVKGNTIEDGDYVVVRQAEWGQARHGDYIVSLIDDYANVKKLHIDRPNHRIVLQSESRQDYTPIIIAEEDMSYYRILGTVSGIIKAFRP